MRISYELKGRDTKRQTAILEHLKESKEFDDIKINVREKPSMSRQNKTGLCNTKGSQ